MNDMPPWERITVALSHIGFPEDGHLMLEDGRRIVVPGDHRCVVGPNGEEDSDARARWREMGRLVGRGRTARVRILDGRLVAVGTPSCRMHPVDMAILSALGLDTEGAMRAVRDHASWTAPGMDHLNGPEWPQEFSITVGNRLTANFEIDGTTLYENGELALMERDIPETAAMALIGRQLSDLVEIPALKGMDLPIRWVGRQPSPFTGKSRLLVMLVDDEEWVDFLGRDDAAG